jgi:hypothetical protein
VVSESLEENTPNRVALAKSLDPMTRTVDFPHSIPDQERGISRQGAQVRKQPWTKGTALAVPHTLLLDGFSR